MTCRARKLREPVLIEAFVSEPRMQRRDDGMMRGLARAAEDELDTTTVSPRVQRFGDEFGSVVRTDL
jgi:hypothetical protein